MNCVSAAAHFQDQVSALVETAADYGCQIVLFPECFTVRGFVVIGVARHYLRHDPESLGHAAVIEWLNPAVATPEDYAARQAWSAST